VNDAFAKKYHYKRQPIMKCCSTCGHHWNHHLFNKIMCGGSFTKEGTSTTVDANGICKRYYPEKMEVSHEKGD
jgi:hypothetical protein